MMRPISRSRVDQNRIGVSGQIRIGEYNNYFFVTYLIYFESLKQCFRYVFILIIKQINKRLGGESNSTRSQRKDRSSYPIDMSVSKAVFS